MFSHKEVKELMVPLSAYPRVYEEDTLKDAVIELKTHHSKGNRHRTLMVYRGPSAGKSNASGDVEEQLIGIITMAEILKVIKKNTMYYDKEQFSIGRAFFVGHRGDYVRAAKFEELACIRAGQFARPLPSGGILPGDSIARAVDLMVSENVDILPVFSGIKPIGVIRLIDILDFIEDADYRSGDPVPTADAAVNSKRPAAGVRLDIPGRPIPSPA